MSVSMATERSLRLTLKLLQFLVSLYLIFSLYNTGPHWILLIACLAVPVYAKNLIFSILYLLCATSWLRVDVAISLTMSVVCFGFSAILFFGYFKVNTATPFYLQAAVASLLLCILYLFNSVLSTRQIEMGTIDFILNNEKQPFSTQMSRTSPLAINTDFGQSDVYFQGATNDTANYNMPLHKSAVSGLTLLERLQVELAQRKQEDDPANKSCAAEFSQEHYSVRAKTSGLSAATDQKGQPLNATHPNYKYSENSITSGIRDFDISQGELVVNINHKLHRFYEPKSDTSRKFTEMPVNGRDQHQSIVRKHQSTCSSISPYKTSSQPYNRKAVPAAKTGVSEANDRYDHSEAVNHTIISPKKSEVKQEHQMDSLAPILKKCSATTSSSQIRTGSKLNYPCEPKEFTQNSSTNSSSASNLPEHSVPSTSSFTPYIIMENSPERAKKTSSSDFTTHMPVYSRKLEAVEPIRTAIHRAVPVKVRPIEEDGCDTSKSDSSTGGSSTATEFERKDGKGSSQTIQSSQGSTVRLDDFDHQMRSATLSISNRMQVNSKTSTSDPIPSIASAIDSGRERQKLAAGGTRLREKIQNHKTGSDGIRTKSMPFRHSTELKIEASLTGASPPSQVTQS